MLYLVMEFGITLVEGSNFDFSFRFTNCAPKYVIYNMKSGLFLLKRSIEAIFK
jgi:hypothetical protein